MGTNEQLTRRCLTCGADTYGFHSCHHVLLHKNISLRLDHETARELERLYMLQVTECEEAKRQARAYGSVIKALRQVTERFPKENISVVLKKLLENIKWYS